MRLLLFSDLHCDHAQARELVKMAAAADVVIGAGDLANMRHGLEETIAVLQAIQQPTVLVPGNNETADELVAACRDWPSAVVLHGAGVTIAGQAFFGLGGGVPVTPFGAWSFDLTEEAAARLLAECPSGCVLISHSPPKGAVDVASNGKSLGSTAVRHVIASKSPVLVVCGHIHASAGQLVKLGATTVINAGPAGISFDL